MSSQQQPILLLKFRGEYFINTQLTSCEVLSNRKGNTIEHLVIAELQTDSGLTTPICFKNILTDKPLHIYEPEGFQMLGRFVVKKIFRRNDPWPEMTKSEFQEVIFC